MKFPRRKLLHLAAGALALPAISRAARICSPAPGVFIVISRFVNPPSSTALTTGKSWPAGKPRRIPTMGSCSKRLVEKGRLI